LGKSRKLGVAMAAFLGYSVYWRLYQQTDIQIICADTESNLKLQNELSVFKEPYVSPYWLQFTWQQIIYNTFLERSKNLHSFRENVEARDGEQLVIDWVSTKLTQDPIKGDIVLALTGITGTTESDYMVSMCENILKTKNFHPVVMPWRGYTNKIRLGLPIDFTSNFSQ
jgi:predicted alpha/beta-fold hydrolase